MNDVTLSSDLDLKLYGRVLLSRRRTVFACFLSVVLLTVIVTFTATSIYGPTCMIGVERQNPNILNFQTLRSVDPAGYRAFYQSQYKNLKSRAVIKIAIERIDLTNNAEYLSRREGPLKRIIASVRGMFSQASPEADPVRKAVQFVERNLIINPLRDSENIEISFQDRSPELSRDLTNAIAFAFQDFNSRKQYTTSEQASEFLAKDVALQQVRIAGLENELQEYGREKKLFALSSGPLDITEQALADLNGELTAAKGRLAQAKARNETVQEASPEALVEVSNSPLIRSLKEQHAAVERKYSQGSKKFKADWPELAELKDELETINARLAIEVNSITSQVQETALSDYEQALAEVRNLAVQVDIQKAEVKRVNLDAIAYSALKEEIDTEREVLNSLIKRRSETETSTRLEGTEASNIRIIDLAELPDTPIRPRKFLNLVLGLILGLGLGVGTAFFLHYVDNSVKTEQDISQYAPGLAFLGFIPRFQKSDERESTRKSGESESTGKPIAVADGTINYTDLISHEEPKSTISEAFRNLRTSLLLSSPDHPPKFLAVTSSNPSEGKSTVCLNLAIVLSQQGKKVLLIDADLRKPRIHKALGLDNGTGLSNYLSGNAGSDGLIQHSHIPNLDIITSGPIPPNPAELVGSPMLRDLLNHLDQILGYDHVLFDSPPALQVADAVILTTKLDGTILVISAGETSRESMQMARARFTQGHGHLFGCVLNGVRERAGYYHGYMYKYSHKSNQDSARLKKSS